MQSLAVVLSAFSLFTPIACSCHRINPLCMITPRPELMACLSCKPARAHHYNRQLIYNYNYEVLREPVEQLNVQPTSSLGGATAVQTRGYCTCPLPCFAL